MAKKILGKIDKKKLVSEVVKCTKDPEYFLENYGYIRHPKRGKGSNSR